MSKMHKVAYNTCYGGFGLSKKLNFSTKLFLIYLRTIISMQMN